MPIPYFFCEDDTVAELILELDKLDPAERQRLLEQLKKGSAPSES